MVVLLSAAVDAEGEAEVPMPHNRLLSVPIKMNGESYGQLEFQARDSDYVIRTAREFVTKHGLGEAELRGIVQHTLSEIAKDEERERAAARVVVAAAATRMVEHEVAEPPQPDEAIASESREVAAAREVASLPGANRGAGRGTGRGVGGGSGGGLSPSGNAALLHEFMQMHSLGIADVLKAAAILVDLG